MNSCGSSWRARQARHGATWPSAVSGVGACRSIADGLGLGADDYLSTERLAVLPGARSIQALSGLVRGPSFRGLLIEDSVERELVEAALPAIRA